MNIVYDDFTNYKLNELKKFITTYKRYHNIANFNRMNKQTLIAELQKKFLVHSYKLYLKLEPINSIPFKPPPTKAKAKADEATKAKADEATKAKGKELMDKSKTTKKFKK